MSITEANTQPIEESERLRVISPEKYFGTLARVSDKLKNNPRLAGKLERTVPTYGTTKEVHRITETLGIRDNYHLIVSASPEEITNHFKSQRRWSRNFQDNPVIFDYKQSGSSNSIDNLIAASVLPNNEVDISDVFSIPYPFREDVDSLDISDYHSLIRFNTSKPGNSFFTQMAEAVSSFYFSLQGSTEVLACFRNAFSGNYYLVNSKTKTQTQ